MPNYTDKPVFLDETGRELVNAVESLSAAMTENPNQLDSYYSRLIEPGNVDAIFERWYADANDGNYTKTQLLTRFFNLLKDDKIYGVKFDNFSVSNGVSGTLTDDSVELGVCTPSTNAVAGTDNFVKQPAFWIKEINYEIDANGEIDVKAIQGVDDSFARKGGPGMVGVAQKSAFYQEYNTGTQQIIKYTTTHPSGFKPLPECVSPVDNSIRAFMVHAKYMGGIDSNSKPTSESGLAPMNYSYSHNSQISAWTGRGANYAGISGCDLKFRLLMFRLKYAKKGNSGTMEGCSSYNYSYRSAAGETDVTRVLLTSAQAANLVEGSWVSVGTAERSSSNALPRVKIKSIETVGEYKAINLDTTTLISPTTDWYISTIPWGSGSCDNVKGVDGSPDNTNGKYPFIIQGLESQIGAWIIPADVIGVKTLTDNTQNITAKMVRKAAKISTSVTADYYTAAEVDIASSQAAWRYIQDFQEDKDIVIPKAVDGGAGSSNGCKCAFYDPHASGTFEWLAWGYLAGGDFCGLGTVHANDGLTDASWYIAAGAPGSAANRGEWQA